MAMGLFHTSQITSLIVRDSRLSRELAVSCGHFVHTLAREAVRMGWTYSGVGDAAAGAIDEMRRNSVE